MLLELLTDEEKTMLAGICCIKAFKAGETVIDEGAEGDSLLLIRSGRVEARKRLDGDNYKLLKEIGEGEFMGEMSFLNNSARSADIVAIEDAQILELKKADLDKLVEEYPAMGVKFYRCVAEELSQKLARNNDDLRTAVIWATKNLE